MRILQNKNIILVMQTFIYHKNITNINTLLNIAGFDLKLYY